ncbi:DoxX family protein [Kordiimonas lacus]|uniref:DoxX-like family protein n=1 Tax=Kordiimonas lacus TaxID=637679 RepID=A0A1G6ZV96_9PROT|nr:DoxX family protein [Kordiimonas lacus]SDE06461.1 DoxX-like family protein [Kordiimonas lacus]
MDFIKKHIEWIPVLIIAGIFLPTLPMKFGGAPVTDHIFMTVGQFLGLGFFETSGAKIIGSLELLSVILLLVPKLRAFGALLASGLMAGAIFFHLASPLGVVVRWQENGEMQEMPDLFIMAIIAFASALWLVLRHKDTLLAILGKSGTSSDDTTS